MAQRNSKQADLLGGVKFEPFKSFRTSLNPTAPWDSIEDFAMHPSFCGLPLYPRQLTLLKLIYLETEQMTAFDLDVIEQWREGFTNKEVEGVQPDIWERVNYLKERGYRHFPHIEAIIGRRGSKGLIGGVLGAEKMAYMYSLGNWQAHYGIREGKDGYLAVVATNMLQAKKFQFADIREVIEGCEYLQPAIATSSEYEIVIRTPADLDRIAYLTRQKVPIDHRIATLHAVAMSSNSSSGRGATGFANFYDEFAHQITGTGSNRSSEEIYEAYQPSLDQFGKDSLTYIPSSPFTQVGHFYTLYQEGVVPMASFDPETGKTKIVEQTAEQLGTDRDEAEEMFVDLTANPEMLVVQLPSWGLYQDWEKAERLGLPKKIGAIQEYNERMARIEKSNPEKFRVERRSQFATVQDAFFDPKMVERMFDQPDWREDPVCAQDAGRRDRVYRAHIDPGLSNANFALAIGHLEYGPEDEYGEVWPHVIIDVLKVWRPQDYEDRTIDYVQVKHELIEYLRKFPTMEVFTADQWNSAGMLADLRQEFPEMRIRVEEFNEKDNQVRMERMKSAVNLGWVHSYRDNFYGGWGGIGTTECLLELEMKFLQRKPNGKVDKQDTGPVTTKDLFDAVNVVTDDLLKDELDRWQRQMLGGHTPAVGSTWSAGLRAGHEQERQRLMGIGARTGQRPAATPHSASNKIREKLEANRMARHQNGYANRYTDRLRGRRR